MVLGIERSKCHITDPYFMFIPNQKVACIDDKFPLGINKLYDQLPVKDQIYVIRDVVPGQSLSGSEGEVAVYLVGVVNPTNMVGVERGFNAERFAPLSYKEIDDAVEVQEDAFAPGDFSISSAAGSSCSQIPAGAIL